MTTLLARPKLRRDRGDVKRPLAFILQLQCSTMAFSPATNSVTALVK